MFSPIQNIVSGAANFVKLHPICAAVSALGLGCIGWSAVHALLDPISSQEQDFYMNQKGRFDTVLTAESAGVHRPEVIAATFRDMANADFPYRSPATRCLQKNLIARAERLEAGQVHPKSERDAVAKKINNLCARGPWVILSALLTGAFLLGTMRFCYITGRV